MSTFILGAPLVISDTLWSTLGGVFVWTVELVGRGSDKCGYFASSQSSEGKSLPRALKILHRTGSISRGEGREKVLPFESGCVIVPCQMSRFQVTFCMIC